MFVVDLLHEFELGVAKGVITQLIRILYAIGGDVISVFNERFVIRCGSHSFTYKVCRFRSVPTFGRDTIRRFHTNVSALTKLAARDFEDILQVYCC
jgi:hypothetical protein